MAKPLSVSFEFFPPKTDGGEAALWNAIRALEGLAPSFVSVTYGAGGSAQDRTVRLTERIARETTLQPMGHLTCVGSSVSELRSVIGSYADAGVRKILALRGDPPSAAKDAWRPHPDGLEYAVELVALVRSLGEFEVGVAAFPEGHLESKTFDQDIEVLALKQRAGAEFAITQIFFRVEDYRRLVDKAMENGVSMPIIPGVMPITNVAQIERFSALSGATFPPTMAEKFDSVRGDEAAVHALGVQVAAELCQELIDLGAPGLHFYTLNRSSSTREVYERLGLGRE